jgi:predicted secreted hydrolase
VAEARLAATLLAALAAGGCGDRPAAPGAAAGQVAVAGALRAGSGANADRGFARALAPRAFAFPRDHGPHAEFRTEWWYYTGNLMATGGRRFGFQLTFFRSALAPPEASAPPRASAWATRQVYLAHFALTDVAAGSFHAAERWQRAALGLAGAVPGAEPFRVWVGPWSAAAAGPSAAGTPPMRLRADTAEMGIDLTLLPGVPPVAEGDHGLSRKSADPGNASYYYSLPRMPARGLVRAGGERFQVTGAAWMDREWSTSSLAAGEVGWDWFALQLADGREVMFYRLRRRDGSADPASAGALIDAAGHATPLPLAAVELRPAGDWRSPRSGATYPAAWRLTLRPPAAAGAKPPAAIVLEIRPLLADQELDLSFRYWEGAVEVAGSEDGVTLAGQGYVEMTGYEPGAAAPAGAKAKTRAAASR